MKKWIAMFLALAIVLCFTACTGSKVEETTENEAPLTEDQLPEETAAIETVTETEEPTETEAPTETELVQETFWAEEGLTYPVMFYFSSGAGGWGTELYLNEDGTFTGFFRDSEMGEIGEGYPNGTVYICEFTGKFGETERLDMYTYSTKLQELNLDKPEGEAWIEDDIRYISSTPYGLGNTDRFMIYLPNTPTEMLTEDQLFWWPNRFYDTQETLEGYALFNTADDSGFFHMLQWDN